MKARPFAVLTLFAFMLFLAGPDWAAARNKAGNAQGGGTRPITQAFLDKRVSPDSWPAKPPVGMGVKSFKRI